MQIREFIFSEKKSDRVKRHLLFWFCFLLLNTLFINTFTLNKPDGGYLRQIPTATLRAFQDLVPQIFLAYVLIGFILPRFILKNRYVLSFLWFIFFVFATGSLGYILGNYVFSGPKTFLVSDNILVNLISYSKGMLVAALAACSIRLFKYWHLKEKRSLELLKEKTEAQLQLLTAQVHPHFLFNTLNNIYSKAQYESPAGAKMIMELSHILRYVLDEGKYELVPLENELEMLNDYVHLEKLRCDEELELHISIPSKTEDLYIAPLLLLPFAENCFQHGTSKMLNNPWINLKIELQGASLFMKLMNGKKNSPETNEDREGAGLENVRKRLDLLYKDKYDLQITEDEEVFVVNLKLELTGPSFPKPVHSPLDPVNEYAY